MGKFEKLLDKILRGTSDNNIDFANFCLLLIKLGFTQRVKGSHHIFWKEGVSEIINVQPNGSKAKAYQVRQVRNLIVQYNLGDNDVN